MLYQGRIPTIRGATLFHRNNSVLSAGYKHIPRNSRMRHVMEYSVPLTPLTMPSAAHLTAGISIRFSAKPNSLYSA